MYKALIIGAGQIAGGFDSPEDDAILTHAHAYSDNSNFELIGFYDIDFEKSQQMAQKWNTKALKELQQADVISICTPDFCHVNSVKEALKFNPKIIFLEKPITDNLKSAQELLEITKNVPVLVNYSRRFVKEFQDLAVKIKTGEFGKYKTGTGYYGKGFIHNGSHMLDLLDLLIGKIKNVNEINSFNDFFENDSTKTANLIFDNDANFIMQGVDCRNFTVFELDLFFEKARVKILNSGFEMEVYEVKNNEKFVGYKMLSLKEKIKTELDFAFKNAVENIYNHLQNNKPLKSILKIQTVGY